jgi:hypothetical protein
VGDIGASLVAPLWCADGMGVAGEGEGEAT